MSCGGLLVPGLPGVPNVSPKLFSAVGKALSNSRNLTDVFKKSLKNYGTGVNIRKLPAPAKGGGIPLPFPFVDFKKLWAVASDPALFKGPEVSEKEGRVIVAEYKRPTIPALTTHLINSLITTLKLAPSTKFFNNRAGHLTQWRCNTMSIIPAATTAQKIR